MAEIKKEIDEKNQQTADDTPTIFKGPAYETSESDLKYLANVGYCEQYYIDGIKAEISLALNKFEQQTRYKTVADYVRYSRWWACHDTTKSAGKAAVEAVRDVVVNGNRTLPPYVNSHDCIDCSGRCSNGVRGDICKIVTNGITYENIDDIKNRNNYIRGNTVVYNKYGGVHIFYTFPCEKCDPFSYSESLYLKYNNKIQD